MDCRVSVAHQQIHDGGTAITFHHQSIVALEGRNANGTCTLDHGGGHRSSGPARAGQRPALRFRDMLDRERHANLQCGHKSSVPIGNSMHRHAPRSRKKKKKNPQSFLWPRAQAIMLMLDPPPSTLPMFSGMERPLWVRARPAGERPVVLAADVQGPLACIHDARHIVATAGLQQEDADLGVLGQSARLPPSPMNRIRRR